MTREYLAWMAANTPTQWCNDSAMFPEIDQAFANGAIGVTTNPPLSYQVLTEMPDLFSEEMAALDSNVKGDERVINLIGLVVKKIANKIHDTYTETSGAYGYVRAQVKPLDSADKEAMLACGKTFASWGDNIKVKIPVTAAGVWVLEELAALGIPTNPTVCVSVPQMLATAQANERGIQRAIAAGITPAPSSCAFVMGRLQDYLAVVNTERQAGLSVTDLENAVLAAAKRCYALLQEGGYQQVLMPAAFRCARQVSELSGSAVEMTIHPKIQKLLVEADERGELTREPAIDNPVDPESVERVCTALPEFVNAYEPDGLCIEDFDDFGATAMTLEGFDKTGWQKLLTL
jgi:transaldolase